MEELKKENPYGLVYDNAITENADGKVNIKPVNYMLNGLKISANLYLPANYDENRMDLINQPLLMIAGSNADTLYMTKDAFEKATGTENKELYLVEDATHIQTYWKDFKVKFSKSKFKCF